TADAQHRARRPQHRRAPARAAALRRRAHRQDPVLRAAPRRAARSHRLGPGEVRLRRRRARRAREAAVRLLLPPAPDARTRRAHRRPDRARRVQGRWTMTRRVAVFSATRADLWPLTPLLRAMVADDRLTPTLLATG